nr:actin cytoskeleton-regulatory complex protein PAN1-like [Aegilops tauschii subsp. strangulata]
MPLPPRSRAHGPARRPLAAAAHVPPSVALLRTGSHDPPAPPGYIPLELHAGAPPCPLLPVAAHCVPWPPPPAVPLPSCGAAWVRPPLAVAHASQAPPRPGGLASPPRSVSALHGCARNRTAGARAC